MQSHYQINVSHNGTHFFATAEHSGTDAARIGEVYLELKKRFPTSEGFEVSLTYWECVGHPNPFSI